MLGQRYAFDFIRVDQRVRLHYHPAGLLRTLVIAVPTSKCYAWGAPVHAMLDGEVVQSVDGVDERRRVQPVAEAIRTIATGLTFRPERLPSILGNHVVIRSGAIYAGFVHLARGSVAVRAGQSVRAGDVVGRVGHTGNSTTPHLHVQLMDSADPTVATGVPSAFRAYEVERDGAWVPVADGTPGKHDRIRAIEPTS